MLVSSRWRTGIFEAGGAGTVPEPGGLPYFQPDFVHAATFQHSCTRSRWVSDRTLSGATSGHRAAAGDSTIPEKSWSRSSSFGSSF